MAFRTDIDDFPFGSKDRSVWYFVVDWGNKTEKEFSTVQDKRNLLVFLSNITDDKKSNNFRLYGVWKGTYKADIFIIPIKLGFQKIGENFS